MESDLEFGSPHSTAAVPVTSSRLDSWLLMSPTSDNLSSAQNSTGTVTQYTPNVADAPFEKDLRIVILYVEFVLGTIGGLLVFLWLWYNRRRKSRVNALILHVAMSDMLVMLFACLSQLIWEHYERQWKAGEVMCKIIKFLQSFAMMSSNFMLVVLSVDRHQAIRAPLRAPFPVWAMTAIGWVLSGLFSVPQFFIFYTTFIHDHKSIFYNKTVCESIFRTRPISERRAYLTYISVVVFFVPLIVIVTCYVRIFLKIAHKANEGKAPNKKQAIKPGKVHLQSTPSSSLPKAKIKTLKMTVVIVLTFIVCGLPYQVLEMIYSYGNFTMIPSHVASILGGMAVANSATNPFVFLLFNVNMKCLEGFVCAVLPCCAKARDRRFFETTASTRSEFTMNSEISRTASKYSTAVTTDCVEMSVKKKQGAKKSAANYTLMEATEYDENLGNSSNIMPLPAGMVKEKM